MKEFEYYYSIILFCSIALYILYCKYTNIIQLNHKNKLIINKPLNLSTKQKFNNFIINILGLLISLLFIGFELNYITKYFNTNIYIRTIQILFIFAIILLIYCPNEYKNKTLLHFSNSCLPISNVFTTIFITSISSFYLF